MLIHQGNAASAFSGGESREKSAGKAVFLPLFARESSRKGQGKRPGLSGSALKLIAACSMLLDHMGVLWIKKGVLENETPAWLFALWGEEGREGFERAYLVLRCAGRLAFPIFAFFLAEGFCHSRNRKRYGLRLLAAALLTEGIFDWAIYGKWFYPAYQNVLFTLLIGFVMLWGIERSWQNEWARAFWIVAGGGGALLLRSDYGVLGVMLILLLYCLKDSPCRLAAGAVMMAVAAAGGSVMGYFAVLAFPLLALYNGERGRRPGKYFFYLFYPGHLLLLRLMRG